MGRGYHEEEDWSLNLLKSFPKNFTLIFQDPSPGALKTHFDWS